MSLDEWKHMPLPSEVEPRGGGEPTWPVNVVLLFVLAVGLLLLIFYVALPVLSELRTLQNALV